MYNVFKKKLSRTLYTGVYCYTHVYKCFIYSRVRVKIKYKKH